jgi:lipopolysaccharide heptosyltransferase I
LDLASLRTQEFRRILLIKLSAVGDVVHTIPVLNRLRRRYPSAQIDWLITPAIAELVRDHPAISAMVLFGRQHWRSPWLLPGWPALADGAKLVAQLRSAHYDLVIDLHGQFRTAVFALATGAPVRIGFDRPRPEVWAASDRILPADARKHAWRGAREGSWRVYSHHIPVPTLDIHAVDRYLSVAAILGLGDGPADFSFPIRSAAVAGVEHMLQEHGIPRAGGRPGPVLMAPGTNWQTKHWNSDRFAAVARHLMRRGWDVVLIGSQREQATCRSVAAGAPGVVDLCGRTTLGELAALIQRSAGCVTNDSGPMHLAVALDRPVVSIFGPTDPVWIGPYRRSGAVLKAELPCSPCYLRELRRCLHDHACMHAVSTEAVIERIEAWLADAYAKPAAIGLPEGSGSPANVPCGGDVTR